MKTYSFLNTVVLVNGVPLTGWAEGDDVIKIERLNDGAMHKVGADGHMAVAISADRSGQFTFKLMQTSNSNKYLNSLLLLQEAGPDTFVPVNVLFQDTYRQDTGGGTVGYIKKMPDVERGVNVSEQEWMVVVERLDMLLGAPAFAGFATAGAEAVI
jgi:hypothetical protein